MKIIKSDTLVGHRVATDGWKSDFKLCMKRAITNVICRVGH